MSVHALYLDWRNRWFGRDDRLIEAEEKVDFYQKKCDRLDNYIWLFKADKKRFWRGHDALRRNTVLLERWRERELSLKYPAWEREE